MSTLTAKFNVFNMQKTLIFKLLVRSIRLCSRETSITHYMQRTNQNMRHFLQQPARCVQAVQFDGDQPWHFSDGKYGLCHHVYWLPADARAVLNHCDVEQDGGNNRTPPSLSTWVPLMQASRVWPRVAFLLRTTNSTVTERVNKVLHNDNPVWKRRGFEKQSLGRELGHSGNILLARPYATRDWHMTS